jgi:hypothetical protein|tara:strand:+ start:856 stop:1140 length:285 start_codon:yes stop_codon:yes gene_type:complete
MSVKVGQELTSKALNIIGDRGKNYGDIKKNHDLIAIGVDVIVKQAIEKEGRVQGKDIALIMDWIKTVRLTFDPNHEDSLVDKVGYCITYLKNIK